MFGFVHDALVTVFNAIIAAVGTVLAGINALFPALPPVPSPPAAIQNINWAFPVGAVLSVLATLVACYVTFLALKTLLRWVKVIGS